ncbi:hypothetical protein MPSEU_000489200 [Mayamaea pseudoterrestris]|nr:hypothetical protein MPSEU_000489200 [Mayamaea pseudoterrestris]
MQSKTYTMAATAASLLALQSKAARAMVSLSSHGRARHNNWMTPPPSDPNEILSEDPIHVQQQVNRLLDWWSDKTNVLTLTGAGLSTESGIPDYRGHNGSYHKGHKPMTHMQFTSSEYQRQRYWGRSMVGWRSMERKEPNQGHLALARLEQSGRLGVELPEHISFFDEDDQFDSEHSATLQQYSSSPRSSSTSLRRQLALVTQNVDSLHRRAGSRSMVELHGSISRVKCMSCGIKSYRHDFHTRLESMNGDWLEQAKRQVADGVMRPDGDAEVSLEFEQLKVPSCDRCNGFIKPDVVFFGDTVCSSRVALVSAAVDACDGLLVVGSSLAVHSAFRHCRSACQRGIPVAILNVGETRAETEGLPGILKLVSPAGPTLAAVADKL